MPEWITILNPTHKVKKEYIECIKNSVVEVEKLRDIDNITSHFVGSEYIERAYLSDVDPSTGEVIITLEAPADLYNKVLELSLEAPFVEELNEDYQLAIELLCKALGYKFDINGNIQSKEE